MICGLDIGGTKIETAIFDDNYTALTHWRVETPVDDYETFIKTVVSQIKQAILKYDIDCIGIGMPGLIDKNNLSLSANVPCCNHQNVQADLESSIGRPVAIENDCRCFALSEAIGGAGDEDHSLYGAILGTGTAGGFVLGKTLYKGANNIVSEYGHIPIPAFLKEKYNLFSMKCGCGLDSCLENYISGPGLKRLIKHYTDQDISNRDFFSGIDSGDAKFLDIFELYKDLAGYAFASIVNHYDPSKIVLGGGLSKVDAIVDMLSHTMKPYLLATICPPPIVRAKFGDSSGVRGAAILADKQFNAVQ